MQIAESYDFLLKEIEKLEPIISWKANTTDTTPIKNEKESDQKKGYSFREYNPIHFFSFFFFLL